MAMSWSLERFGAGAVFAVRGYLSDGDISRFEGATAWVHARSHSVLLDLVELQGCSARAQKALGRCVTSLAPGVVMYGVHPSRPSFRDPRLLRTRTAASQAEAFDLLRQP